MPPADTGNPVLDWISNTLLALVQAERRVDPFFRPWFDALLRERLSEWVTDLINKRRTDEGFRLAEEREQPERRGASQAIIDAFSAQMRRLWNPGYFERGGNTKTHGVVRAEVTVRNDVPAQHAPRHLRRAAHVQGLGALLGPGPSGRPDIEDIGFLSMAIKLMGVPGPEADGRRAVHPGPVRHVRADVRHADARAKTRSCSTGAIRTRRSSTSSTSHESHVLDSIMNSLWTRTQPVRLECQYFSTVPYLLGKGQAMKYSFHSRLALAHAVPNLPGRPPDDYLRQAMAATLARQDVEFDICVQMQTDPFLMPIENASVMWPTRLSPRVPAAAVRIPRQTFDSPEQIAFARVLTTTRGTASRSTVRSATSAARASGCTGRCRNCG